MTYRLMDARQGQDWYFNTKKLRWCKILHRKYFPFSFMLRTALSIYKTLSFCVVSFSVCRREWEALSYTDLYNEISVRKRMDKHLWISHLLQVVICTHTAGKFERSILNITNVLLAVDCIYRNFIFSWKVPPICKGCSPECICCMTVTQITLVSDGVASTC